eukprot:10339018-Heterocapsa_arctica.AAC.1
MLTGSGPNRPSALRPLSGSGSLPAYGRTPRQCAAGGSPPRCRGPPVGASRLPARSDGSARRRSSTRCPACARTCPGGTPRRRGRGPTLGR